MSEHGPSWQTHWQETQKAERRAFWSGAQFGWIAGMAFTVAFYSLMAALS